MEAETVELGEESAISTNETSLDTFNYLDYLIYFPEDSEPYEYLVTMFREKKYGWKSRARLLITIDNAHESFVSLKARLADLASETQVGRRKMSPKDHLRKYLESLEDISLQAICTEKNVSYKSFMASNDKSGLVEAILDEMVASD